MISLGFVVVDWIETYCVHGPGDVQGTPFLLDDELAAFIVRCYELDERGRRKVDRAFFSRSKGRAKSELAGALACAELLGPVRFDGWDADGEPVGRPVVYPFVRCLATEAEQSGNTYDNISYMLGKIAERDADEFPRIDIGRDAQTSSRVLLEGGGEVRPSTSSSAAKDGGKESFYVFDETHLYTTDELRKMHRTVRRNGSKRRDAEPWGLDTSTMYGIGEGSVAEATHKAARAGDAGLLFDHVEGPAIKDTSNRDEVIASLRVAYGAAAGRMDLERMAREHFLASDANITDSIRYFTNRAVKPATGWIDRAVWDAQGRGAEGVEVRDLEPGDEIVLGFDGSESEDSTVLSACRISDGYLAVLGAWEKDGPNWTVPRSEVDATLHEAMETYTVRRGYFDPPYWREEVDAWATEYGDTVVVKFPTSGEVRMAAALDRFRSAVTGGRTPHDGDPVAGKHIGNARVKKVRAGDLIVKPVRGGPEKIDAAITHSLAHECRAHWLGENTSGPSVYETRGILVL